MSKEYSQPVSQNCSGHTNWNENAGNFYPYPMEFDGSASMQPAETSVVFPVVFPFVPFFRFFPFFTFFPISPFRPFRRFW